jgi:hypothetical protein
VEEVVLAHYVFFLLFSFLPVSLSINFFCLFKSAYEPLIEDDGYG